MLFGRPSHLFARDPNPYEDDPKEDDFMSRDEPISPRRLSAPLDGELFDDGPLVGLAMENSSARAHDLLRHFRLSDRQIPYRSFQRPDHVYVGMGLDVWKPSEVVGFWSAHQGETRRFISSDDSMLQGLNDPSQLWEFENAVEAARTSGLPTLNMDWVYVHPDFREAGFAHALMGHFLTKLPEMGEFSFVTFHDRDGSGTISRMLKKLGLPLDYAIRQERFGKSSYVFPYDKALLGETCEVVRHMFGELVEME